jgi:hypothetical protein
MTDDGGALWPRKIEKEAEAFARRRREAEKKARQRRGLKTRPIVVHDETCVPDLVARGLLRDIDTENEAAINDAYAALIRHYCHPVRVLALTKWWEARDDKERPVPRNKEPQRHSYLRRHGDNRPPEVGELPRFKVERKRSGTPTGKNPLLATNTIYNARGMVIGRVRPGGKGVPDSMSRMRYPKAKIGAVEKEIVRKHGKLTLPDKSVHTISLKAGEAEGRLDSLVADEELRWAKRKAPPVSKEDVTDDPATYS